MKTRHTIAHVLALSLVLTGLLNIASVPVHSSGNGDKAPDLRYDLAKVKESYSKIPLSFEANHGQADKSVKFISRGSGYSLALAPATFTMAVTSQHHGSVIQATLLNANAAAKLTGLERLVTRTNYLTGRDPRSWKTNIPN